MIPLLLLLAIILIASSIGIVIYFHMRRKTCSCIGKICGTKDECGNICPRSEENQKCGTDNKVCSTYCTDCRGVNGCGDSCTALLCQPNQVCYEGNCCTPNCSNPSIDGCQSDGCGGTCPCPQGEKCYTDGTGLTSCCSPPTCNGTCGGSPVCGITCDCQNRYCSSSSCCNQGTCQYTDICNSPVGPYLKSGWGKFCNTCTGCKLVNAKFENDAVIPIEGKIVCDTCDTAKNVETVIDNTADYYFSYQGQLYPGKDKICSGNCSACSCFTDDDCKRFGCSSCVGTVCQ